VRFVSAMISSFADFLGRAVVPVFGTGIIGSSKSGISSCSTTFSDIFSSGAPTPISSFSMGGSSSIIGLGVVPSSSPS
jgi:hypothetical protein